MHNLKYCNRKKCRCFLKSLTGIVKYHVSLHLVLSRFSCEHKMHHNEATNKLIILRTLDFYFCNFIDTCSWLIQSSPSKFLTSRYFTTPKGQLSANQNYKIIQNEMHIFQIFIEKKTFTVPLTTCICAKWVLVTTKFIVLQQLPFLFWSTRIS